MKKILSALLPLCLLLVTATPGSAAESAAPDVGEETPAPSPPAINYASTGFYVGVGGGLAFGDLGPGATGVRRYVYGRPDSTSGVFNLRGGYRFHPNLAAEVLWDYETGWDFPFVGSDEDGRSTLSAWNLTANLKAYLTRSQWQPFVVAGLGVMRREAKGHGESCETDGVTCDFVSNKRDTGFVGRVGGGMDVHLSEAWQFGGEVVYVMGSGDLSALHFPTTTLVLTYIFR